MDDFSEIDRFVEELFNRPIDDQEVLDNQWRIEHIDQVIQDAYDEVIRWHNQRISEGADPESGLHGLPYIPWDERLDGVAAMMGACGPEQSSLDRNGGAEEQAEAPAQADEIPLRRVLLIIAAVLSIMTIITAILATV